LFFSWFQCTQTVFKINTIIYRNINYLLNNFIIWNESWNVQIVYIMVSYIQSEEWKYLFKFDEFYIIDEIILLMLKLVSNKIDTYLTSLWRHRRYLFSVFREILPAIFGRFSKKLSTSDLCFIYFNNLVKYFSGARLRRCLMSSKIVQISRAKFHEIQKTNNADENIPSA
jgi:hypothetical protein